MENDALTETLFDIKKSITQYLTRGNRHIVYSENYQIESGKREQFFLAEICVGNVICYPEDEEIQEHYQTIMEAILWNQILSGLFGDKNEWFLADDHAVNQKILAVKLNHSGMTLKDVPKILDNLLGNIYGETKIHITICGTRQTVFQEELWDVAKRLRNEIKQRLIVGKDAVIYMEDSCADTNLLEIVKMKMNVYIKNYSMHTDLDNFLNELQLVFKYMKESHAPQDNVEKICVYVLKLLEFVNQEASQSLIQKMQDHMMRLISLASGEEEMYANLLEEFRMADSYIETITEEKLEETVMEYVNAHYLTIESVEEVAQKLNYNYTYLSRLFKKKAGKSMNKYITEKKIALAKELLISRPETKMSEVGELCGYQDSRYFSRVFRTETGYTPSQYRELIMESSEIKQEE